MTVPFIVGTDNKSLNTAMPTSLDQDRLPNHIAIIMDGNGRWAKQKKLPRTIGHTAGVEALKKTLRLCSNWGIKVLTVYAFSTENWSRPKEEVNFLMKLFESVLQKEIEFLNLEDVRVDFIGELKELPVKLQDLIKEAIKLTKNNTGICFNVCANYGGRRELVRAAQKLANRAMIGELHPALIDENIFKEELFTSKFADPDLLIRTSGEKRISNFLLWQLAYAEIHITDVYWPDFNEVSLTNALLDFQSRRRRFGGVDQISSDQS